MMALQNRIGRAETGRHYSGQVVTDFLPRDLAAAVVLAGVDAVQTQRQLEDAIRNAITDRRGYLDRWRFDHAGWHVTQLYPVREEFRGLTLATALGWCLVLLMSESGDIGVQGFAG